MTPSNDEFDTNTHGSMCNLLQLLTEISYPMMLLPISNYFASTSIKDAGQTCPASLMPFRILEIA